MECQLTLHALFIWKKYVSFIIFFVNNNENGFISCGYCIY